MCPPLVIRIVASPATIRKWRVVRTDAQNSFIQTGPSARSVYVIPRAESRFDNVIRLLVVDAYGLINSSSKWQKQSDGAFLDLGLQRTPQIPPLFAQFKKGEMVLLVSKIVHDFFLTGIDEALRNFISSFNQQFHLVKSSMALDPSDFFQ